MGGVTNSNSITNSAEYYNFSTKKWQIMPSMNQLRKSFVLLSLPNGIYAIGGHDGKNYLNST